MEKAIHRREFVHRFFATSVLAVAGSSQWITPALASIEAAASTDGLMLVKLSDYPALSQSFGSIRIGVNRVAGDFPDGRFYPILINRTASSTFHILSSRCTHAGCVVGTFVFSQQSMNCNCHGSKYNLDGTVRQGPATERLPILSFVRDGDYLKITVPNMAFSLTNRLVPSGAGNRVELKWRAFRDVTYELVFKSSFNPGGAGWQAVPFALTPTGSINQTTFVGTDNEEKIYVNPPAAQGFYEIRMKVSSV